MEKEQCNFDFKFGVLFVKKDQNLEDEIFSNRKKIFLTHYIKWLKFFFKK